LLTPTLQSHDTQPAAQGPPSATLIRWQIADLLPIFRGICLG